MDNYLYSGMYGGGYVPDLPDPDQVSDHEVHMIPSRSKSVEVSPSPLANWILVLFIESQFDVCLGYSGKFMGS